MNPWNSPRAGARLGKLGIFLRRREGSRESFQNIPEAPGEPGFGKGLEGQDTGNGSRLEKGNLGIGNSRLEWNSQSSWGCPWIPGMSKEKLGAAWDGGNCPGLGSGWALRSFPARIPEFWNPSHGIPAAPREGPQPGPGEAGMGFLGIFPWKKRSGLGRGGLEESKEFLEFHSGLGLGSAWTQRSWNSFPPTIIWEFCARTPTGIPSSSRLSLSFPAIPNQNPPGGENKQTKKKWDKNHSSNLHQEIPGKKKKKKKSREKKKIPFQDPWKGGDPTPEAAGAAGWNPWNSRKTGMGKEAEREGRGWN
ncbi:uncharacterized protein LOC131591355 [Poecile atricapillus]|uniref:uncharacterized protein LOC131591355 n=1 Tax=Poecile atricapillus TaxID=48891 RepID=UPI002738F46B|nr:uncharacterized protein LOC131591355 [Poecile atricapillus]XP_058717918.1 uncharacterized protein LOC131591355 [Poecile atricapillus]XP_058717919.1 uncharacterized protein LOC131591355 [Poecile atricapillus]XP_058717920.1 uncharacterized protein LOC131591355 [Poecile atricapillus]XP_058717921.1 uncharacterized protein LOC131591355 [Poecile atricapillus]